MSLQIKNKKAISVVIGYVLLVTFVVVISAVVYQWMKTYVPAESLECSDGVSFFVKDLDCTGSVLSMTLVNNGRFSIEGYFIHSTDDVQATATKDLSQRLNPLEGFKSSNNILFDSIVENSLEPGQSKDHTFDLSSLNDPVSLIELIPTRWEIIKGKKSFATCENARIMEYVTCV